MFMLRPLGHLAFSVLIRIRTSCFVKCRDLDISHLLCTLFYTLHLAFDQLDYCTPSSPILFLVMGPAPQSNLPSRPKFSWDAKSPPWTDGKGDQEEYRNSVKLWQTFHNALPDSNSNKIPPALQAICLKSQLYGRAKDLCSGISEVQLTGDDAA